MEYTRTSQPSADPSIAGRHYSAHVYAVVHASRQSQDLTLSQLEAGIQKPETAHLPPLERRNTQSEGFVTVAASDRRASTRPLRRPSPPERALSDFSIASSGVSVTEIPAPEEILEKVESQGPGTYHYVITNVSDHHSSFDSIESRLEKSISLKFELQRLDCLDDHITTRGQLRRLAEDFPMPEPKHGETYNKLRYRHFAVYQRLFACVLAINIAFIAIFAGLRSKKESMFMANDALNAVSVNIIVCLLMRQEHCINVIFRTILSLPHSCSISIRRHAAKVYCHGGMHSACGISALLWYIFFAVLATDISWMNSTYELVVPALSGVILFFLLILTIASTPWFRREYHNVWEVLHRFVGWFSVAILWGQLFCINANFSWLYSEHFGRMLVKTPSFWMLIVITLLLIYPWLYLRKVFFVAEKISSHAIQLRFKTKKPIPSCVGMSLSDSPFIENHKFATIPAPDKQPGYSVIVATNGDWTKRLCESPPKYLWTRGIPTLGVARVAKIFRRVVLVATGTGIGPLMSFFNAHPDWAMRIVWSARFPCVSYGQQNISSVLRADNNAIIIDTKRTNLKEKDMPNLVSVTYAAYRDFEAEAVVVISNPAVTNEIVYSLEKRKVPAYGAIWDS
ncbi:putative ferredoxin-NADP reductase (FNR), nucleotide-binding domain-containing protein [Septoria linicola]|nr:putative ferredoxin-NADP reductase (FNR), nucleotide-binding domain-containing protein [Septoria linicola]